MQKNDAQFWQTKSLNQLTKQEWESLCDHCGRCCLLKLENEYTGDYYYTNVICQYQDTEKCQCTHYLDRKSYMPDCLVLTPEILQKSDLTWFPSTCAYRLLSENKPLPWWHPLISGTFETVYQASASIRHRVISENEVDSENLEDYIIEWAE